MLRQRIHTSTIAGRPSPISDANTTYPHVPISHLRHCIGAIRQALMCAADITPIVWQWSEPRQLVEQRDDVVHVCRDFGSVRRWAEDEDRRFISRMEDFRVPPGKAEMIGGNAPMDWGGHHNH
ncbi:hypothetical protein FB45DRAFT_938575 [Roridomyces roridus]|uniref:Uncharacterized protein n=1 Tax=Roridomyces roridus TaxID=1738132 RepID=A0AAD7B8V0_9AGAR|nr:hypothetical protein FB45DRAFT_938575 [Roridomyces roridus]